MYKGGEGGNGIWHDSCTARKIRLQFQGEGANPWLLGSQIGFAQGICHRPAADGHFSSRATLNEVQLYSITMLGRGSFSATTRADGSGLAEL